MGQQGQAGAVGIVARIGVGVPLSHQRQYAGTLVLLEALDAESDVGLVGGRDDRVEARLAEDRLQHADELHLRLVVEVATLLRAVGKPEVGDRLVERLQRLELYAVFILVVLADIYQVVCELLVVLGSQVVLAAVGVAADAAAVGHVVRT